MSGAANVHASVVAFGPFRGVLILGPSGAGKSRLALRLVEIGAQLVADDQVFLCARDTFLYARAPRATAGMIEMRGLGLLSLPHRRLVRLALAVDMSRQVTNNAASRLPEPNRYFFSGIALPCIHWQPDSAFPTALARYVCALRNTE